MRQRAMRARGWILRCSFDIAKGLSVSKPSVSFATKNLRENGYIPIGPDNRIHLTGSGRAIAARMVYCLNRILTILIFTSP